MKVDHVDRAAAWKTITETDGSALGVERVSIWLFNEDRSAIVCRDLYGLSTQSHEQGAVLDARLDRSRTADAAQRGRDHVGRLSASSRSLAPISSSASLVALKTMP